MNRRLSRSAGFLVVVAVAAGEAPRTGPQELTFRSEIDGTDQPYALYLPRNYNAARRYPLVISLHDAGSNHRLNLRRVFGKSNLAGEADSEAARYFPALRDVDFVVASPLARGTMGYLGIAERDIYDALADVERRFSIDEDRVYLTGVSMGGGGALWLALTRPDVWAAVALVSPAAPAETMQFAPNALHVPVRLIQGGAAPVTNPERVRDWAAKLRSLGTSLDYDEYPIVRHAGRDSAYKDGAIFSWFEQFKRNRYPDRVRFVTDRYKYSSAYWTRIDQLTPGVEASIDARFAGANRLEIVTEQVGAFTLMLTGHPQYSAVRLLRVTIDGKAVRVSGKMLSFSRRNGAWVNAAYKSSEGVKRKGLEGPVGEALAARHLYVYGTADRPSEAELAARREIAGQAAAWSTQKSALLLSFKTVADRDVKADDFERGNLVLFGTKETNSIIARMAAKLPLELNAGAADYGLVYVFPNGGNYVVINSGLPWWSGSNRIRGPGLQFLSSAPAAIAADLGDYLLFKGSLEEVVAAGRFDDNWRLPPEDAVKVKATLAVTIK